MTTYKSTEREKGPAMISDRYLDDFIGIQLLEENAKEQEKRTPSGKLSASMLSWPLQWQILKKHGVPPRPIDEYAIRKMLRGKHCEEWFVSKAPGIVCTQEFREYRGVIGYEDTSLDTGLWNNPVGIIPVEIKSVANAKYKRIISQGADRSHILQNCLYALASGKEKFAIVYIAADDYRIATMIYETKDIKSQVDSVIDRYEKQGVVVPVFEPEEKWQADPKYNSYPDWSGLTKEEITIKLAEFQNEKNTRKEQIESSKGSEAEGTHQGADLKN